MRRPEARESAEIAAEFDGKAATYETDRLSGWYRAQADVVLRVLRPEPGEVVLDLGCGTGWLLRQLARENPGVRGIGVDLSAKMIDVACRKSEEQGLVRLTFVHADWMTLDFAGLRRRLGLGPPDTIVCVSAFHYFADPRGASEKVRGALALDGRFLLLDRAMDGSAMTTFWQWIHANILKDHVTFHPTRQLVRVLESSGFARVEVLRRLRRYLWKSKLYTSLVLLEAENTRSGADDEGAPR